MILPTWHRHSRAMGLATLTCRRDTVSYSITAGNRADRFAIGDSTEAITVEVSLANVAGALHTLTVQASDGTATST